MRNMFVNYRGGATSRAGTVMVGRCKQTPPAPPPRDIPFQFSVTQGLVLEFGEQYMRVKSEAGYVLEPAFAISAIASGTVAVFTVPGNHYDNGDWVVVANIVGPTQLNSLGQNTPFAYIIANVGIAGTDSFTLTDLDGNSISGRGLPAYIGGGTIARIFELDTPYHASDLPLLKYTQSADVISLTHTSYAPYDLARITDSNWTLTQVTFQSTIGPPAGATAVATVLASTQPTLQPAQFSYVVTAVDQVTGEESIASNVATVSNGVDIAITAGNNVISWSPVSGAGSYNVYKGPTAYGTGAIVPIGSVFGFIGSALGTSFTDSNVTPDLTKVPPLHLNPFAQSAVIAVPMTNQGGGYVQATTTVGINSNTGSGFVGIPVVAGPSNVIVAVIVQDGGEGYLPTDSVVFNGVGTGAAGTLTLGPATGTFPGVVAYFQQRRFYANTLNNPDTYYASQPGAFTNMDAATPPIDSDAIVGTPFSQQVNGIQALVTMPSGLVILTGRGAWQLSGGQQQAAVTPADQDAVPQAYNGCSPTVPPIVVNYDILYVQEKGSIVRDLAYNFFVNIYTGTDMTVLSNHLFTGHQILQWAYAEEPYKIIWCVREDGILLSFTYLKEQDVYGWARHDTLGLFQGVCVISEPAVNSFNQSVTDAVYVIVKRKVQGRWLYFSERMDDRLFEDQTDAWFVDCGLRTARSTPRATLYASSAAGGKGIGSVLVIDGGQNFVLPPTFEVYDPTGSGAVLSATVQQTAPYAVLSIQVVTEGQNYTNPKIIAHSQTGTGLVAQAVIDNDVTFTADQPVFTASMIGKIIRMGGGVGTITSLANATNVVAELTAPITNILPDDPTNTPLPAPAGTWSLGTPTTIVGGLNHLNGSEVAILADGGVVPNQTVVNGTVTLPEPASAVIVGLPYTAQLQSLYLDVQGAAGTIQGKRKTIQSVTVRVEQSRGFEVGTNQVDASTVSNTLVADWETIADGGDMAVAKDRSGQTLAGNSVPLFTGDIRVNVPSTWRKEGQIAIQQENPLPLSVLAIVPEVVIGDTNG